MKPEDVIRNLRADIKSGLSSDELHRLYDKYLGSEYVENAFSEGQDKKQEINILYPEEREKVKTEIAEEVGKEVKEEQEKRINDISDSLEEKIETEIKTIKEEGGRELKKVENNLSEEIGRIKKREPKLIKEIIKEVDNSKLEKISKELSDLKTAKPKRISHSDLSDVKPDQHHSEKHILESHKDSDLMDSLSRLTSRDFVDDLHKHKMPAPSQVFMSGGGGVVGGGNGVVVETDPIFTAWDKSTGISIAESQITDLGDYIEDAPSDGKLYGRKDEAWAEVGGAGEETDPVFTAWDKSTGISITESQISDFGAYLESETDPVFTAWDKSTGISITESQISDLGSYEPVLGNPDYDGYVLSSTAAGVRSWVAQGGGVFAHSELTELDYASSGHTGFQPAGNYLTEETDPDFNAWDKSTGISIIESQISDLGTYLENIVEDTTPQLGGDLDLNGKGIDFPSTANVTDCKDEDDMASNSATMLATQQSIKAYVDAKYAMVSDSSPDSDHSVSGITATLTAGTALTFGQICYMGSDGKMELGDADAASTSTVWAMCADVNIAENATGTFLLMGFARDDTWNWATLGGTMYLDTVTSGGMTQTAPSGVDDVVKICGYAVTADIIYFFPEMTMVVHT